MSNEINFQYTNDPYGEFEIERTDLSHVKETIKEVRGVHPKIADKIAAFAADPVELSRFIDTIFRHSTNGFVQFRMFVDGDDHRTYSWPWQAAAVGDRMRLFGTAIAAASSAALSPQRVNFCPPVVTFVGPERARNDDICEGVVIMAECDEQPALARQMLEVLLGTPTLVVASGGVWTNPEGVIEDKLHLYWRLAQPTRERAEHDRLNEARDLASRLVSSDPTAKPAVHPLRWPGSWHKKATPRLARIVEINEAEVELDAVLVKLRAAATALGIRLHDDKPAEPIRLDLSRAEGIWQLERDSGHIVEEYLGLTYKRHPGLSTYTLKIAMSALNYGYDLASDELFEIAKDLHRRNPGKSAYSDKELRHLASDALSKAIRNVGNDPAYKKKAAADAYWDAEWRRMGDEIHGSDQPRDEPDPDDDPPEPPPSSGSGSDKKAGAGAGAEKSSDVSGKEFAALWLTPKQRAELTPPVWAMTGLVMEDSHNIIIAPPEHLKSFVGLGLVKSFATGEPFLDLPVVCETGPTFYFLGEGQRGFMTLRDAAWDLHHGWTTDSERGVPEVYMAEQVPYLSDAEQVERFIRGALYHLRGRRAAAFAIDTMSNALDGLDEDKSDTINRYKKMVVRIKAAIGGLSFTIHHTGHNEARARGSSNIRATFDGYFMIKHHAQDRETKAHTIDLCVDKQKDADGKQHYYARSVLVTTPQGTSLALEAIEEGEARQAFGKSDNDSSPETRAATSTTADEVEAALKQLVPMGGVTSATTIGKKIGELFPNRNAATVMNQLSQERNRTGSGRFAKFYIGQYRWSLPGGELPGSLEGFESQLRSFTVPVEQTQSANIFANGEDY